MSKNRIKDVRDLKIHNYVNFLDRKDIDYCEIIELTNMNGSHIHRYFKDGDCDDQTENLLNLTGIKLTPKWAEKLGFKEFKLKGTTRKSRTWYRDHFFIYFGKKKGPKMNRKFPLPYVHNLQNLWWEMKKTPLKIIEND